jgi:Trk-type K+ transport system membrane component
MYIAIFPIAISIRASNTYIDDSVGIYGNEAELDDNQKGSSYLLQHMRNQLGFDLWYIFLGIFCICAAESKRLTDVDEPAFNVFAIFFEVVSGYGNVGLSLGYPTNLASLSGEFNVFSKLVMCLMMIRGRHRGLPHSLDRAIVLEGVDNEGVDNEGEDNEGDR